MTDPLRVLVIDDDFRVAGLHRDLVDAHPGCVALDPARTLADAAARVRTHEPDLLLVDAFLPDGDGIEFVREVPVDAFVLSAADDAPTIRRALRSGALAYLIKPFEQRALRDRLDRYLRFRNLLGGDRTAEQEQIDRAVTILHGGGDAPSVSRTATEQLMLETLASGEGSASELAARAGLSRATAQRHLAALAARGLVEVRLRYGSTGRPEHRYELGGGAR